MALLTLSLLHGSIIISVLIKISPWRGSDLILVSIFMNFMIFFYALWFDALRKDGKSYYD